MHANKNFFGNISSKRSRLGRKIAVAALIAGLAATASGAKAGTIDWTLTNLVLTDGTHVTGTFEINVYGYLSNNWDITTSDGAIPGWHYTPTINAAINNPADTILDFYRTGYNGYLQLAFTHALTFGPTDPLDYSKSYECSGYQSEEGSCTRDQRHFNADARGLATQVPEPASLPLLATFGAGLLALSSLFRRKAAR